MDADCVLAWLDGTLNPYVNPWFGDRSRKVMLVLDSYRGHLTDAVEAKFGELNIVPAVIPAGCTSEIQPLDVAVNRSFKAAVRQLYQEWLESEGVDCLIERGELNPYVYGVSALDRFHPILIVVVFPCVVGNIRKPPPELTLKWISKAWKAVPKELIQRSFLTCGISNALDGQVVNPRSACVSSEDNWTPSSKHEPHARRTAQVAQHPLSSLPVLLSVSPGRKVASQDAKRVGKARRRRETKNLLKQGNEVWSRPSSVSRTITNNTSTLKASASSFGISSSRVPSSNARSIASSRSSSTSSTSTSRTSGSSTSSSSSSSTSSSSISSTSSSSSSSASSSNSYSTTNSSSSSTSSTSTSRTSGSSTSSSSTSSASSGRPLSSSSATPKAGAPSKPPAQLRWRGRPPPRQDTRRTSSRQSTRRLSTLRLSTPRLRTLRLSTPKLRTLRLSTPRPRTPRLSTLRPCTLRLSTPRLRTRRPSNPRLSTSRRSTSSSTRVYSDLDRHSHGEWVYLRHT
ncbi:unnamed protein product [Closterium sp. NIES-54]